MHKILTGVLTLLIIIGLNGCSSTPLPPEKQKEFNKLSSKNNIKELNQEFKLEVLEKGLAIEPNGLRSDIVISSIKEALNSTAKTSDRHTYFTQTSRSFLPDRFTYNITIYQKGPLKKHDRGLHKTIMIEYTKNGNAILKSIKTSISLNDVYSGSYEEKLFFIQADKDFDSQLIKNLKTKSGIIDTYNFGINKRITIKANTTDKELFTDTYKRIFNLEKIYPSRLNNYYRNKVSYFWSNLDGQEFGAFTYKKTLIILRDLTKIYKTSDGVETEIDLLIFGTMNKDYNLALSELKNEIQNIINNESVQNTDIKVIDFSDALINSATQKSFPQLIKYN
jgi:hypothetical protein